MNKSRAHELVRQSLEAERGGVQVYQAALECVVDERLREEWEGYLAQIERHVAILTEACNSLGIDLGTDTPGSAVVRHIGESLVKAMQMARESADAAAAELVACECVVFAETKDHADWELIGQLARKGRGEAAAVLQAAYDEVEEQEDAHLYHSKGWCRELWIQALGLDPVLPPPEERLKVKTAIGAAKAQASVRNARPLGDTEPSTAR